jgi:hypothetical protein
MWAIARELISRNPITGRMGLMALRETVIAFVVFRRRSMMGARIIAATRPECEKGTSETPEQACALAVGK